MDRIRETQPVAVGPGCCQKAGLYVRLHKAHHLHGPDETGWCLTLYGQYDPVRENVSFCPWCGKEIPKVGTDLDAG